jgi:hypothetical protein
MRHEAIVLLAAVTSIALLTAGVARAKLDLPPPLNGVSPFFGILSRPVLRPKYLEPKPVHRRDPETDRGRASVDTPRMITWGVCRPPSSGSALSIYSSNEKPDESRQGLTLWEGIVSDLCDDDEEERPEDDAFHY